MTLEEAVALFRERAEMDRQSRLDSTSVPRLVDRVGPFEVYLLGRHGERLNRICGYNRDSWPDTYVCRNAPGWGTTHKNYGRCRLHDTESFDLKAWAKSRFQGGAPSDFWTTLDQTTKRLHDDPEEVYSNFTTISQMIAVMQSHIDHRPAQFRNSREEASWMETLRRCADTLSRLRSDEVKNQTEMVSSANQVWLKEYMGRLFSVLRIVNPEVARIAWGIHREVLYFGIEDGWSVSRLEEFTRGMLVRESLRVPLVTAGEG